MITFVVALKSEARPITEHFGLRTVHTRHPYEIVGNERFRLVVSGMGKAASAAATSFCAGRFEDSLAGAWLNVGIGGHRTREVGTALLAHKVNDAASDTCWYPSFLFDAPCDTADVTSFDAPNLDYPEHTVCDMEAAGFVEAASRLAPLELVHVVKVVSDTASSGIQDITRERVVALIEGGLDTIEAIAGALARILEDARPRLCGPDMEDALKRWRFTARQRMQLAAIACRWAVLMPGVPWRPGQLDDCPDAATALEILLSRLDRRARREHRTVSDVPHEGPRIRRPGG